MNECSFGVSQRKTKPSGPIGPRQPGYATVGIPNPKPSADAAEPAVVDPCETPSFVDVIPFGGREGGLWPAHARIQDRGRLTLIPVRAVAPPVHMGHGFGE
jgi:hypothetical protein